MPTIPAGLDPVVENYAIGAPDGVMRTDVAGGAPRYALEWDRGVQQFRVTLILNTMRFSIWTTFFHHVIKKGALSFEMPLDSGYGVQLHTVSMLPGTYTATPTGGGPHAVWTVSFTVEAESAAYGMSTTDALAILDLYGSLGEHFGGLLERIGIFANQDTLVLGQVAPAPAPPPPPAEAPILFGSRADGAYPYGAVPTLVTADTAATDASILAHFQKLVDHHVVGTDIAPGLPAGGMMPRFTGAYGDAWTNAGAGVFKMAAVSEGFGYWLILCAIMHGATMGNYPVGHPKAGQPRPTPKEIFDGMLKTILARPAYQYAVDNPSHPLNWLTDHLMEWSLNGNTNPYKADGVTLAVHGGVIGATNGDGYSAPDGDLDIALGLGMAARQWPNDPNYDYADLESKRISALKWFHYLTDGTGLALKKPFGYGGDSTPFNMVRPSDFMFNHYRTFATRMNDPFWLGAAETDTHGRGSAYTRQLRLTQFIQSDATFNSTSGLMPDFIEGTDAVPPNPMAIPAQNKLGHGDAWLIEVIDNAPLGNWPPGAEDQIINHGREFNANSVRIMFRYVIDYLYRGNADLKVIVDKMMDFWKARLAANGGAASLAFRSRYNLDGTPSTTGTGELAELYGSILAGTTSDFVKYGAMANTMWRWNRGDDGGRIDGGYYAGELQLFGRIVAAGLWWVRRNGIDAPTGLSLPPPPAPSP